MTLKEAREDMNDDLNVGDFIQPSHSMGMGGGKKVHGRF